MKTSEYLVIVAIAAVISVAVVAINQAKLVKDGRLVAKAS